MKLNVMLLPGDGVGPEVVEQAVRILEAVGMKFNHQFSFESGLIGGCSIDQYGVSLTDETVEKCKRSSAVLMGAVGGPKWDDPSAKDRPERGLAEHTKGAGCVCQSKASERASCPDGCFTAQAGKARRR